MKNQTKRVKKLVKQILNKDRQFISKLNKTFKNKDYFQKCEHFCKKDYMVEMNKVSNNFLKKYNIPIPKQTKQDKETTYNGCKRMYCNPQCDGFSPKAQTDIYKKLKNGFQKKYSPDIINQFKTKGALSACVDNVDYNVFHK